MSTIDAMLESEKLLLERKIERLVRECDSRPRGSITMKRRGNYEYAYLVRRENGKVVMEYLGRFDMWKINGIAAKLKERKKYEEELKQARIEYERIMRMLKASKRPLNCPK
jgi:hypothetical protein